MGDKADKDTRFGAVVRPHIADALTFACWLVRDRHDAEDVVQDACLRAYQGLDGFSGYNARAWVLAIVRNTAWTWIRKHRPGHVVSVEDLDEAGRICVERPHDAAAHTADAESTLIAKADAARLDAAIAALPIEFREPLVLREFNDLGYREIAEVTGLPMGTVMSRLSRARERLIKAMKDES